MTNPNKSQSGFTLIELIVVIVILGILSVTAIPRYLDLTEEAHIAMTEGVTGAFRGGVVLANAEYLVKYNNGEVPNLFTVTDTNGNSIIIGSNNVGNPVSSDGTVVSLDNDAECSALWIGLLKTSLVAGTSVLVPFTTAPDVIATIGEDNTGTPIVGVCDYLMRGAGVDMQLRYNSLNGQVDLTRLN